ncbi:MAG: YqjK family protein [Candidatus Dasytiphilus stammeri]
MNLYDNKNYNNKLLCTIQEQRVKLSTECNELIVALKQYEILFHQLLKMRYIFTIISSIIIIFSIRNPRILIRLSKKCFAIWKIYKTMRYLLINK